MGKDVARRMWSGSLSSIGFGRMLSGSLYGAPFRERDGRRKVSASLLGVLYLSIPTGSSYNKVKHLLRGFWSQVCLQKSPAPGWNRPLLSSCTLACEEDGDNIYIEI